MNFVIGVDLGGTKTAAGLVDANGTVLARAEKPTPANDGAVAILATVIELARVVSEDVADVAAVGIGAAGVIDSTRGIVVAATDALPGWAGTEIASQLERALALPVSTVNDVHAHGIGEAWTGAARGFRRSLMVAAGTGIGGAWVVDGAVDPGAHFVAGHLGHVPSSEATGLVCSCGRIGHLEAIASGPAIYGQYVRAGGDPSAKNTREVFVRAEAGDELALRIIANSASALGRAVGGFINFLDPDVVVLSGGLASAGELWWSSLRAGIARETMDAVSHCPVVVSGLGSDAAIIGAAYGAFAKLARNKNG